MLSSPQKIKRVAQVARLYDMRRERQQQVLPALKSAQAQAERELSAETELYQGALQFVQGIQHINPELHEQRILALLDGQDSLTAAQAEFDKKTYKLNEEQALFVKEYSKAKLACEKLQQLQSAEYALATQKEYREIADLQGVPHVRKD